MNSQNTLIVTGSILMLAIFVGVIAIKVSVWGECRADHSWLYCLSLISR